MVVIEELSDDGILESTIPCHHENSAMTRGSGVGSSACPSPGASACTRKQIDASDRGGSQECTWQTSTTEQPPHGSSNGGNHEPNVFCNIYDITPKLNSVLRCFGYGIYHTGVEVYGKEFAFGGHNSDTTGIWAGTPKAIQGAIFRKQVPVGYCDLDPWALRHKLAMLAPQWSGKSYETLTRNCHSFTETLCAELTGSSPPPYINRCAKSCCARSLFHRCILPVARCLERCGFIGSTFVSYQTEDEEKESAAADTDYCVSGARGMNQVLVEAATAQKNEANTYFRVGAHDQAARGYMQALFLLQAISRLDEDNADDQLVMKQASEVCKAILLNIAACMLKAEDWNGCIAFCNRVLEGDSMAAKAYFRRGVANSHIGKLEESIADLQRALQLSEPSDATTCEHIQREVDRVMGMRQGVPGPNTPLQHQT